MALQEAVDALGQPATLSTLKNDDLKWVLEPSFATEGMTFYLTLDNGSFALLQMVYSTMGLSTSIQTSTRVYSPKTGMNKMKTASHWASIATFSDDKTSVSGDVINYTFNPETNSYSVQADIDGEVVMDFEFTFVDGGLHTKTFFNKTEDTGYIQHNLIPRGNVKGTITVDGEEIDAAGTGFFVNAVQLNPQNIKRWNFCSFTSPELSMMIMQFIMPEGYDYDVSLVNRSLAILDGKLLSISPNSTVEVLEEEIDEETGYSAPQKIRYTFIGKTLQSNEDVKISLTTNPATGQSFEKMDLLSELPWLVRKALQMLISKPFLFQYIDEGLEAEVQVGNGEARKLKGRTFEETVHMA